MQFSYCCRFASKFYLMKIASTILFCLISVCSFSQAKKTNSPYKVPPLYTTINGLNHKAVITPAQANILITKLPVVKDDKNTEYSISSYIVAYYKVVNRVNEETGKVEKDKDLVSNRFFQSAPAEIFTAPLINNFQTGEEIFYTDIIVKDSKGRIMYAPDVRIFIK